MSLLANTAPEARATTPLSLEEWRRLSGERLQEIDRRLAKPLLALPIDALCRVFEIDSVCITARRPAELQDFPELPVRVRGAFGRVLRALGPPVFARRDYGARPRAWEVLFEDRGRSSTAKPMTVETDLSGDVLNVRVKLFGFAGFWLPDAANALLGALEGGITIQERSRHKIPIEILDLRYERQSGIEPPTFAVGEARLHFVTPFRLRSGDATNLSGRSLLIACMNRLARLAPWQNARLVADWNDLHGRTNSVFFDEASLLPYAAERGSQRAGQALPVSGGLGRMTMRGALMPFAPFLHICEAAHVGSHAALGYGRFRLALLP